MKNKRCVTDRALFFLHSQDEMRPAYESALKATCGEIRWFKTPEELLEAATENTPLAVLVDLDLLRKPFLPQLEQVRAAFPGCDRVALSSSDSAKVALECLHTGFNDFLMKPVSPEELAWSVRKTLQRNDVFRTLEDPKSQMVRAMTQISSCTTPTMVRVSSLEILQRILQAEGVAWLEPEHRPDRRARVLCSTPRNLPMTRILSLLPRQKKWLGATTPKLLVSPKTKARKLLLPAQDVGYGFVLAWGIKRNPGRRVIAHARLIVEHSALCLLNLSKFEEIKQQTFVDDLTGLYNSRYLRFALTHAVQKARGPGQSFSVLFIDVDHFKSVNDTKGHLVGSEFLVAIGKTIKNSVRQIDPVFRYGGDEFVVILQGTPKEEAREVAERIRKHIERRVFIFGVQKVQTTVSIGLASYPDHATDQETLLRLADEAMYGAKRASRNSVHLAEGVVPARPPGKLRAAG